MKKTILFLSFIALSSLNYGIYDPLEIDYPSRSYDLPTESIEWYQPHYGFPVSKNDTEEENNKEQDNNQNDPYEIENT